MFRRAYPAALLLALLAPALPAAAGTIRGELRVPVPGGTQARTMNAYPGRANSLPGSHGPMRGLVTDAVLYVVKIPARAESSLARAARLQPQLAQKDEAFVPRVTPVAVGTTVDFPNMDAIYHNVFSLSPTKRFDLGKYPKGKSKAVRFDREGLVKVYCDIHSEMEAFVYVLPNHAFTQPGEDGAFQLPTLPAGRYELKVWHPDLPEIVRTVELTGQADARLDLSF